MPPEPVDITPYEIDYVLARRLTPETMRTLHAVPLKLYKSVVVVAVVDPSSVSHVKDEIQAALSHEPAYYRKTIELNVLVGTRESVAAKIQEFNQRG